MIKLKLTALFSFILGLAVLLPSCKEDDIYLHENIFSKQNIPMNGSQVVPPNSSIATGSLNVEYNRREKTLSYTIRWENLSGAPTSIAIYGLADAGFLAPPAPLGPFTNGIAQTITGFPTTITGSYSGTLYVDGVLIRETDLLNGKYYVLIRTAAFPAGQIRGQIDFR
ncbi:MAG: hypothetical protein C4308_09040 [Chitinophagaceae bacterium]